MDEIKKCAVFGAGVMGAGIAAHLANAGVEVLLLDIVPHGAAERSVIASSAIARLKKAKPAPLMGQDFARLIRPGNTEDDLAALADCDWIVEAVLEDLNVKRTLYQKIAEYRPPGSIISSNTSTLPISSLMAGMAEDFQAAFLITHFFNPPRYMRLVEIVQGAKTSVKIVGRVAAFLDRWLGKDLVYCNDTPGFIANRIGTYWLQLAVTEAVRQGIGVEAADSVLSRPLGIPKTGVFGLLDLVGLDLMPHIMEGLKSLPAEDPFHALAHTPALLVRMVTKGYTGRKGKGGFYRLDADRQKQVISLEDGTYHRAERPQPVAVQAGLKQGVQALLSHDSPEGRYAWTVAAGTLSYVAGLVPEIANDIESVDRAMRLGYNWKYGPFELLDRIGVDWFKRRLASENRSIPKFLAEASGYSFYRHDGAAVQFRKLNGQYQAKKQRQGVVMLADIKRAGPPIMTNRSASLWDIGDGVACFEFHSKMNSLNLFTFSLLQKTLKQLPGRGFKALVIYNEGGNFSVGANIAMLLVSAKLRLWPALDWILRWGQVLFQRVKYAPFPVVGSPAGLALGGGCEVLLHCDALVAHAESYIGLVETGVGLVPGWGGCKELLGRWQTVAEGKGGPMPASIQAFDTIVRARTSTSAFEARDLLFLKKTDDIVMNRDRLLMAARDRALELAEDYQPPEPHLFKLAGLSGHTALKIAIDDLIKKGVASNHDAMVATELARILTGGDSDHLQALEEKDILRLERQALILLAKTPETRARIAHTLRTGKPLRN